MYKVALSRAVCDWGMDYLRRFAQLEVVGTDRAPTELPSACGGKDAVLCRGLTSIMDEKFFREMAEQGVKVIASHGTGLDGCDLDAATKYGIPVVYAPGANARSVAEYTVALMLAMIKEIHCVTESAHNNDLSNRFTYRTREFYGMKLYVIGFGNIGRQVAQMCRSLGMEVSAYDKYMAKEQIEQAGFKYCENIYDDVPNADIISIHTPLTEETRDLVGKDFLEMMKPGSYFVNTARPELMDEDAVCDFLDNGKLAGVALDAASIEKPDPNPRTVANRKIVLSYHVASMTNEAQIATAKDCADGIEAVLNHKRWRKTANPEVYDKLGW